MIRTIALPLFTSAETEWLAPAACELARVLEAHVTGVHASQTPVIFGGMGAGASAYAELYKWHEEEGRAIGEKLDEAARMAGVPCEFRASKAEALGREAFVMSCLHGADMVVMSPVGTSGNTDMRYQIVRRSGRPVMVLPKDRSLDGAPKKAMVGWSDTREAARAAHDVLPLLAPGAEVELLAVHHDHPALRAIMDSRADFAGALDRLGFRPTLVDREAGSGATAEVLMKAARESGAEVIATGAFGHSQLYDFVIGAVTADLLEKTPIPALLSK